MIKSITLKNFQSHEESKLEFHEGVNVICGPSDSGKTSIFRALRWVKENRPLGSSFIKQGSKGCSVCVEIITPEGLVSIEHSRNAKSGKYTIGGINYEAMGSNVPEEITAVFNFQPENIQYQLELPYLVLESPGKVAEVINEVTHLEKADMIGRELERLRRESNRKTEETEKQIEEIKKQLESPEFVNLEKLRNLVEKRTKLVEELEKTKIRADDLEMDITRYSEAGKNYAKYIPRVEIYAANLEEIKKGITDLVTRKTSLTGILTNLDKAQETRNKLSKVDSIKLTRTCGKITKLVPDIVDLKRRETILSRTLNNIKEFTDKLDIQSTKIDLKKGEEKELLSKLTSCPLCGTGITSDEQKERIIHGKIKD